MDGFFINKKFHAREVGYVSLTENRSDSYRFKLNHLAVKLSEKDWKTVHYCRKYIHGLTLKCLPWEKNLHHVENLRELLKNTTKVKGKTEILLPIKEVASKKTFWTNLGFRT